MVQGTMTNSAWQERKENVFARGMGNIFPIYAERASNAEVWDVEGKRYIDFAGGIAVVNTGHSHPEIVKAVRQQLEAFSHTCVMVTPYSSAADDGLILISCGVRGNVIRILAPLTIPFEQVDEGLEILRNAFKACI
jgi:4-aminobutyrate aminotransferase/(S)-3-amino-2-methylpropionate transaminase